jgi:magnesium-transporting ATPase (P-type)
MGKEGTDVAREASEMILAGKKRKIFFVFLVFCRALLWLTLFCE